MTPRRNDELQEALFRLHADRTDASAWEAMYEIMWPLLLPVAFREVKGDSHLAQDAVQDAFLRMARYTTFTELGSAKSLRGYLTVVVRNAARDAMSARRRAREQPLEIEDLAKLAACPSQHDAADLQAHLEHAIAGLAQSDQRVLMLAHNGMTVTAIAEALGLKYSAAALRLHRARQRLRKVLVALVAPGARKSEGL